MVVADGAEAESGSSGACWAAGQFLALLAPSALAAFCGHSLAGCLPKHSMHAHVREVALSAVLAALGVVAEANRLAFGGSVGTLLELLSAFAILALAVSFSALAALLGGRLLCVSVPGLRPFSVQG